MDKRTIKLMTMHKVLHPRDDVDRLYVSKKGGEEKDLPALKIALTLRPITAIKNDTDNTKTKRMTITRKQEWGEKQLYGRFKQLISNISHKKTWTCLRKGNFKRETEYLLITAQSNAIRTNHIKAGIDKTQQNSKCKFCGDRDETINHIISEYGKLVEKEYKTRHHWVGKGIHWVLCKKFKFDNTNKWYMHNPSYVLENDTHKLL